MNKREFAFEIMETIRKEKWCLPNQKSSILIKGERAILAFLEGKTENVTAGEISQEFAVSSARIAFALNNLEKKKLIKRVTDVSDKRKTYVYITPLGKKTAIKNQEMIIHDLEVIIDEIGEKKIREHIMILTQIKNIIDMEHRKREKND